MRKPEPIRFEETTARHSDRQKAAAEKQTRIYVPGKPSLSWREFGPQQVLASFWKHRGLILQLSRREVAARYRGSMLGVAWSLVTPLLMLAVYTFVFTVVFETRWEVKVGNQVEFALILFAGLIVFNIFSECFARAPVLLAENPSYIKRIVFPLEILAWIALVSALFNAVVSMGILLVAYSLIVGLPPATVFWTPVVIAPFALLVLGLTWILAPLGLFVRDIRQVVGVILPIFMFASPLFYPLSALPEAVQPYMALNPLAFTIEQLRAVALFGTQPDFLSLAVFSLVAVLIAWSGLVFFLVTKRGFADVL